MTKCNIHTFFRSNPRAGYCATTSWCCTAMHQVMSCPKGINAGLSSADVVRQCEQLLVITAGHVSKFLQQLLYPMLAAAFGLFQELSPQQQHISALSVRFDRLLHALHAHNG